MCEVHTLEDCVYYLSKVLGNRNSDVEEYIKVPKSLSVECQDDIQRRFSQENIIDQDPNNHGTKFVARPFGPFGLSQYRL